MYALSSHRADPSNTIPHSYQLTINFRRVSRKVLSTLAQNGRIAPVVPIPAVNEVGVWGLPQHKRGGALEPADGLKREIETLRNRLSGLSEAGVRITENLDLDTVLQEVVDAARSLTGARISGLTALDEAGGLLSFITSGMIAEERQRFVDLPGGPEFFAHLSSLPEPLRVADFSAYTTALGLPEIGPPLGPVQGFLGAPIRHRGRHIGNLYLSDKKGGLEFTQEDEDTLLMFASQAAMAITNARRHWEEQRARADLETLVNTCPVGVVVFDAKTGAPSSLNREGRRIVDGLRNPDQPAEELLQTLTYRRADGRETSLQEFPIAQALSTGETVRAEEIVMQVPDGRSVTTIINATPIRSEEGELESVVVTLQDMTALEELERLRAEFLGMVSHELRGPLTSIKGSAATVLGSSTDMEPAVVRQFFRIIEEQADHMHELVADLLDVARIETGTLPVAPEPAEVAALVDRARNTFISSGGRNNLAIEIGPDLPLVMADRLRIVQVLGNLLSNAATHSPESSVIRVSAVREGVYVAVSVADEGRGIPSEQLPFLFRKFTRIEGDERGSGVLGSGLGLAICKGIVEAHGGPDMGRERGSGHGSAVHLHASVCRRVRERHGERPHAALGPLLTASGGGGGSTGARPRGGRRPPGAQVRQRRTQQGGLCAAGDWGPGRGAPPRGRREARSCPARHDAAGRRRDRVDEGHPGDGGRAGDLPVRLWTGPACCQGLGHGGRGLRRQALLANGACGEDQGGPCGSGRRPSRQSRMCWAALWSTTAIAV